MKMQYAVAASLLLSLSAFAQKEELKALKKLDDQKTPITDAQVQEYNTLFSAFESKMGAATEEQKRDFYYYRGTYYLVVDIEKNPANVMNAVNKGMEDINKLLEIEKNGKKKYTEEIQTQLLPQMKMELLQLVQPLQQQQKFKEAATVYALIYKIDPKDPFNLYNAAAMAINAKDYDKALEYYLELDKLGFTGEQTYYIAKNKANGQEESFKDRASMDAMVKTGVYEDPKEEKQPSVHPEIVKNIALIYNMKGETEKAKSFFANARKENPSDVSLIVEEANMYYKQGDMATYKKLISEAVAKSPNDHVLFYNLGVVNMESQPAEAEKYFLKTLELKPDYYEALVNLGTLQLASDKKIVDEMNKLGTSAKDNARYEVLKKQREAVFNKALPYLEKAYKIKPSDENVVSVLGGIYQALNRMDDYKALKARAKKN